jgi:hypothetical protein
MKVLFGILFVIFVITGILAFFVSLMFYRASEDDYPVIEEFQKKCPKCRGVKYERINRKWWMYLIPGTKYYNCDRCRSKFAIIFWRKTLNIS